MHLVLFFPDDRIGRAYRVARRMLGDCVVFLCCMDMFVLACFVTRVGLVPRAVLPDTLTCTPPAPWPCTVDSHRYASQVGLRAKRFDLIEVSTLRMYNAMIVTRLGGEALLVFARAPRLLRGCVRFVLLMLRLSGEVPFVFRGSTRAA